MAKCARIFTRGPCANEALPSAPLCGPCQDKWDASLDRQENYDAEQEYQADCWTNDGPYAGMSRKDYDLHRAADEEDA